MPEKPIPTFMQMRQNVLDAQAMLGEEQTVTNAQAELTAAQSLALIQVAQELNEIKHILVGRREEDVKTWLLKTREAMYPDPSMTGYQVIDVLILHWEAGR